MRTRVVVDKTTSVFKFRVLAGSDCQNTFLFFITNVGVRGPRSMIKSPAVFIVELARDRH